MEALNTVLLCTIKGTNLNKGRARTWLERKDLGQYGFSRGTPVTITFTSSRIEIYVDGSGSRKVAGRDTPKGEIQILDICYPVEQRDSMFNGAERLAVFISRGCIVIEAAQ